MVTVRYRVYRFAELILRMSVSATLRVFLNTSNWARNFALLDSIASKQLVLFLALYSLFQADILRRRGVNHVLAKYYASPSQFRWKKNASRCQASFLSAIVTAFLSANRALGRAPVTFGGVRIVGVVRAATQFDVRTSDDPNI